MAAKKKPSPMDFIVAALKKNKNVAYATVKEKADKQKISLFPVVYGRAKAALGLVPTKPRRAKKKAATGAKRGPGRPRKKVTATRRRDGQGRAKGSRTGGSKSDRIRKFLGSGMTGPEIAKKVGCSVNLVYAVKTKTGVTNTRSKRGPRRPRKATATINTSARSSAG